MVYESWCKQDTQNGTRMRNGAELCNANYSGTGFNSLHRGDAFCRATLCTNVETAHATAGQRLIVWLFMRFKRRFCMGEIAESQLAALPNPSLRSGRLADAILRQRNWFGDGSIGFQPRFPDSHKWPAYHTLYSEFPWGSPAGGCTESSFGRSLPLSFDCLQPWGPAPFRVLQHLAASKSLLWIIHSQPWKQWMCTLKKLQKYAWSSVST